MSGGVDSSVTAALLKEQGFEVIGITMKLWDFDKLGGNINHESGCCSLDSINDARMVCDSIGAPHYVFDLSEEFHSAVIDNFVDEYLVGRTPNPCVMCNKHIKWGTFWHKARKLGADYLATGHYARVSQDPGQGRFILRKGMDHNKDQSYALWGITQKALAMTLFPIGELTKVEVREHADRLKLKTANKSESQEICFIPDNDYARFLDRQVEGLGDRVSGGEIVTAEGDVVGHHRGYPFYTIGQRRGVGVAMNTPIYVTNIDHKNNRIEIGGNDSLLHRGLTASQVNWVSTAPGEELEAEVKIRYNDAGSPAIVSPEGSDAVRIAFREPQRAVTPGQSVVFYDEDRVLGGGIIDRSL